MATENKDAAVAAAAALFASIEKAAKDESVPAHLRDLAEAYALVAGADPKKTGRVSTL